MNTAVFFLFALFFVAAECDSFAYTNSRLGKTIPISRSNVFFNMDGTQVAYSINHVPSGSLDASVYIKRKVPVYAAAVRTPAIALAPAIIPRPDSAKATVNVPVRIPFYAPVNVPAVPATPVVLDAPVVKQINPMSVPVSSGVPYHVGVVQQAPIPLPYNAKPHNNAVDAYQMADPFAFGPHPFAADYRVFLPKY